MSDSFSPQATAIQTPATGLVDHVKSPPSLLIALPRDDVPPSSSLISRDPGLMTGLGEGERGNGIVFSDAHRQIIVSDIRWKADRYEQHYEGRHITFALCRSGGGRYQRVGDKQKVTGEFLPGTVTVSVPCGSGVLDSPDLHLASIGVTPARLQSLWSEMVPNAPLSSLDGSRFYRDPLVEQLIIATVDQADDHALSSLFFDHVLSLIVHQIAIPRDTTSHKPLGLSKRQFRLAIEFMRDRLAKDIHLRELANLIGLSVGEFSRRFRVSSGRPPYSYFMQLRMEKAIALMADRTLSVSEISARVGYLNPSQFARSFQKSSGLSPMKWRKVHHDNT